MMRCPRCSGAIMQEADGNKTCMNCGHIMPDEAGPPVLTEVELDIRGQLKRGPKHAGVRL